MVTTEHAKVSLNGRKKRHYISYFQSVSTIGIINRATTVREAESKAALKLKNSSFMCGVVNQTPFELHATDEWTPTLASTGIEDLTDVPDEEGNIVENPYREQQDYKTRMGLNEKETIETVGPVEKIGPPKQKKDSVDNDPETFVLTLSDSDKECMADKFCKDPKELSNEDYVKMIQTMIEMGLE